MKFYSTNNKGKKVPFREAVIKSLPDDNGLYFPETLPVLSRDFFQRMDDITIVDVAFEVLKPFCHEDIPDEKLHQIIRDTFIFDLPVVEVEEDIYCLELFHGPTMAFKDVGARFLARTLSYLLEKESTETTILVATSGDTGGAVASGFYHQPGIKVVILYPKGKVTPLQERQMTTLGANITALEVNGDFDDCQALVKQAFLDKELNERLKLSSANSINIARWLPQSVYYYVPFAMFGQREKLTFSVPSGNYGNSTSGMLAKKMGLPIHRFIVASNANNVVPRYLESGVYHPIDTIQTVSNAMDVGKPSNFTRLQTLYHQNHQSILEDVSGFSLSDEATLEAMTHCYKTNGYLMDPHSTIAYQGLKERLARGERGIFLGTAHYSKFLNIIHNAIDPNIPLPPHTQELFEKEMHTEEMTNDYESLKEFLW